MILYDGRSTHDMMSHLEDDVQGLYVLCIGYIVSFEGQWSFIAYIHTFVGYKL